MKFLIAGAGAIGAYIGARMAQAGLDVTLFARGPHLRAMQEHGVRVRSSDGDFVARPTIADSLEKVGPVDVVFLGVKAHGLPQLAAHLKPVLGPDTTVVSTQNGIPWWYFQGFGGEWEGLRLERVDPGGVISSTIEARRVIGSIVYFSTEIVEPGVVQHIEGNRISLGEPDGMRSERLRRIAEALIASGLRSPVTTRIRHEIWVKVLGNASLNPVSALTRATLVQMVRDPGVCSVIRNIMQEVEEVSRKLGMELPVSIDQRIAGAEKVGEHKTSMLQDLEAARPMELEALVGAVVELGERAGLPMTCTRTVYNCTKLLAERQSR
ncbi:MAG TPA: 2-dehydropantoate 2-reductase [Candidatus Sulfotelmatobacter sp.]|jgi:2-dehydropantoate 2-reductase|nr:2-dehydropantoate 2-reductase [Candidatus Sulfotelmatobacter sp.]